MKHVPYDTYLHAFDPAERRLVVVAELEEELEDVYRAALDRALLRRAELLNSKPEKAALRRGWIAYPEYWQ